MKKLFFILLAIGGIFQNTKAVEGGGNPCIPQYPYTEPNYFVLSDDYININTERFFGDATGLSIPNAFSYDIKNQNEYKYLISVMRLADTIRGIFARTTSPNQNALQNFIYPSSNINPKNFSITKTSLINGYLSWAPNNASNNSNKPHLLMIRPNDNVARPCVFLSNGASENLANEWNGTVILAADLAMRGYAVCLYETLAGAKSNLFLSFYNNVPHSCHYNLLAASTDQADKMRFKSILSLLGVHLGVAAEQFVLGNNASSLFNINTNQMYTMGASAGASQALTLAYADNNPTFGNNNYSNAGFGKIANCFFIFFNDIGKSIRQIYGDFTSKSRFPNELGYRNGIRAAISIAGAYEPFNTYTGNFLDGQDANCPTLFLHAINDAFVNINLTTSDGNIGPANLTLINNYISNQIHFHTYVNCNSLASHPLFTVFNEGYLKLDFSKITENNTTNLMINDAYNNPTLSNANNIKFIRFKQYSYYGLQLLSTGKIIGNFLVKTTEPNSIQSNVRFYMNPIDERDLNATPFPGTIGDFFSNVDNTSYPDGKFESISHWGPCGPNTTILIPDSTGCYPIPNTIFGGWLHNQISGARQANPSPSPSNFKITNLPFIYPNPTSGKLNINLKLDNVINGYNVSIFSVDGKNIYNNTVNETLEAGTIINNEFDISNQANGIYFIRVTSENNLLLNQKFVLNK
ncbi:MAG: T9SS type A sorting domain-containing protein [Bacteroidetes bacterium]|nr:T9SS type A sorting domain-containing protein [Bacteroidota bacterium]